jgi:hypothetical protein
MLESVEAMASALKEFSIRPGHVSVRKGDSRHLQAAGIAPGSLNAVITSPPYSIALDYVENDEHALTALGYDTSVLREGFIGVRGRGVGQKARLYEDDMKQVFRELGVALRPGGQAVFVVGNVTIKEEESLTTESMVDWAAAAGLRLERDMPKIVWGLYNLVKDERILFFRKE